MKEQIHPIQRKIFSLFKENKNKLPPFRDIAKQIGVSSTNTVFYHVKTLKAGGYLGVPKNKKADVIPLTLRSLLHLDGVSGVYVIFDCHNKKRKPFLVGESQDVKKDLLKQFENGESSLSKFIKDSLGTIEIAFHIIDGQEAREKLRDELRQLYTDQGVEL